MSRSPQQQPIQLSRGLPVQTATVGAALGLLVATLLATAAQGQQRNIRHFRVGLLVGANIDADFSQTGEFGVSGSAPGEPAVPGVDHTYDDGYVRVDDTGNAMGLTSFWGYNDPSQYSAAEQTLTYSSATGFRTAGESSQEDAPYLGLDTAYGSTLAQWGATYVSWELGFSYLPITIRDDSPLPGRVNRIVHQFNTGGILVPSAPYQGGSDGTGPVIPDVATALESEIVTGQITGSRELEVSLYNLRIGPHFHWELHRKWAFEAGAGFAAGIVNGSYRYNETILLPGSASASNSGSFWDTQIVYGGYANAMLLFHFEKNSDIFLGAQFMSLGDATFSSEGRSATLNLGQGLYLSAGLNWYF